MIMRNIKDKDGRMSHLRLRKNYLPKYLNMSVYVNGNKEMVLQRIPKPKETFSFFDDGKIRISRMYQATVLNVYEDSDKVPEYVKEAFQSDMNDCDWLYNKDENGKYVTDVFIECSIPGYDENTIWFVRDKTGGFFSLDIQSGWQGGRLDVDGRCEAWLDSLND